MASVTLAAIRDRTSGSTSGLAAIDATEREQLIALANDPYVGFYEIVEHNVPEKII